MLKLCTLTGIDKRTSFEWVIETASLHPTAEFGILFSATADGSDQRYPDRDFISDYAGAMQSAMVNTALHICGRAVRMFVEGDEEIRNLAARFGRVQLNFNAQHIAFSTSDLDSAIAGFARPVITQHNEANADVTAAITARNHHVLFDASGGRGIHSQEWPSRLPGKLYGFAGGFGPETLMFDLEGAQRASAGQHYWIDMESRLRRDNWLDTSICESVLRLSSEWFDSEVPKARHDG
ncbi:hypothetical protein G6L37_00160 [Agrobacterium rubi]|nr:hypothetical protein [Agrobacterium rubi]NTF23663.1 hypothetical protein [Agrobacterium rubi]